jgi:hypothetical protein
MAHKMDAELRVTGTNPVTNQLELLKGVTCGFSIGYPTAPTSATKSGTTNADGICTVKTTVTGVETTDTRGHVTCAKADTASFRVSAKWRWTQDGADWLARNMAPSSVRLYSRWES